MCGIRTHKGLVACEGGMRALRCNFAWKRCQFPGSMNVIDRQDQSLSEDREAWQLIWG